jgi:hypothetical protein
VEPNPTTIRGQSPGNSGFGLPRPLASLAKSLKERSPTTAESSNVGLPSGTAPQPGRQGTVPQFAHAGQPSNASPVAATWPANSASVSPNEPLMQEALRATVRLRVEDGTGHSLGTGTIIDVHGEEALVVTCAHIFRESRGQGPIHVDCFASQPPRTVKGSLISCDLERDVAMVAIAPDMPVRAARIAPPAYQFSRGQPVFSAGCDRGADPSIRNSTITAIDRYLGAPNLEVAGMPVQGRSGGGLFSAEGFLIGVCNAADPQDQEGIFASLPVIHWELDKIGQRALYDRRDATSLVAAPRPAANDATRPTASAGVPVAGMLPTEMPRRDTVPEPSAASWNSDMEVICIVRSRTNPQGSERLFVLDRPSPDLLHKLTAESQKRLAADVAHAPAARSIPLESQTRSNPHNPQLDGSQIIRAQSFDR